MSYMFYDVEEEMQIFDTLKKGRKKKRKCEFSEKIDFWVMCMMIINI